jgi:hypothetical protein
MLRRYSEVKSYVPQVVDRVILEDCSEDSYYLVRIWSMKFNV